MSTNITVKTEKDGNVDMLTVSLPISKAPSKSGKTTIIASTHGGQTTSLLVDGKQGSS